MEKRSVSDIANLLSKLTHNKQVYVGYPTSTDFDNQHSFELLNHHLNNIGDPFNRPTCFGTFAHERAVVEFFMQLYHTSVENAWGYVAGCSTEAILYACWRYREEASNKVILLSSEYAHYCNAKIANILGIRHQIIPSHPNGSIQIDALSEVISAAPEYSYILVATMGSTITSSYDDVAAAKSAFLTADVEYFIHLDGAFDGAFLPLVEKYRLGEYFTSVNVSGHKFLGAPMPSGILLIDKQFVSGEYIQYINNDDITIGGSRNGLTPVLIYNTIKALNSQAGMKEKYLACLKKAEAFLLTLQQHSINCWKNEKAITIVLEDLPAPVSQKWHFPQYRNRSTLTCLPKFTPQMLNEFITDALNPDAIDMARAKQFDYQVESL
ncbi:histidine decarboxylase [Alteromonas ponticola]|uniref:Histidine decarboxylase n=1 Tax=Alteromonas aquimaris TaxID=2998417 RepID=A0ABT3P367_9ALTE|nr:histidine decarboxylase [Alteromonas aquimaris]MCW8107214.1 histidine decarboxylase [Alteromonas aquimaris]